MLFSRKLTLQDAVLFAGYIVIALFLLSLVMDFMSVTAFRHDELRYISSYKGKLTEEGRWVNYLFFHGLQHVDIKAAAGISLLCFFVFSYRCMENILEEKYAGLAALLCLFIPPVHLLNEWAQTSLLSFVILAMAALAYKSMPQMLFFLFFGVLFNGVLSHFYFLLPLLFLGEKKLFRTILYWMAGFIIGFLAAQGITWIMTGKFIHLADWRKPHYIHSFDDLVSNVKASLKYMERDFRFFEKPVRWCILACSAVLSYEWYKKRISFEHVLILILVSMSIYAMSIPAGVYTATRSALCLFMAVIFIFILSLKNIKCVMIIFMLSISLNFYNHNVDNIRYVSAMMNIWKNDLLKIGHDNVNGIVMISSEKDFVKFDRAVRDRYRLKPVTTEGLGMPMRWVPAAYEAGFRKIYHGQWNKNFLQNLGIKLSGNEIYTKEGYYEYTLINNYLVVKLAL